MADVFTKKKRSEIMSRIRSQNTSVEKIVFLFLEKKHINFQRHYKKIFGCPDIALPRKKIAVFIDGDFWHGWRYSLRRNSLPKNYWRAKIESNIERDKKNRRMLRYRGWKVMRVWEHQLKKNRDATLEKLINFLTLRSS